MYELLKVEGRAKRGRFHTPHGTIETPVFMNVQKSTKLPTISYEETSRRYDHTN